MSEVSSKRLDAAWHYRPERLRCSLMLVLSPEILRHEMVVVKSIIEGRKALPALVTNREIELVDSLQFFAAESIIENPVSLEAGNRDYEILIFKIVLHCWIFCGRFNAWREEGETIWEAFRNFVEEDPFYQSLSTSSRMFI